MKCEVNGMNKKGYKELSDLIKNGDMKAAHEFLEDVQTALVASAELTLLIMLLEDNGDCQE